MLDLDFVKLSLKIDTDADDELLTFLIDAATDEVCLLTGRVKTDPQPNMFDQAVMLLTAHRYTNRAITTTDLTQRVVPYHYSQLIENLKTGGI